MIALTEGFIELEDLGGDPWGGMSEWLLVYLWKLRLKQAFVAGIPKEYMSREGQLTTVRGNLDINSLLRLPADMGKYTCQWREHSFDNPITRLIYTTFETLSRRDTVASLISDVHREKNAFGEACGGRIVQAPFTGLRRRQNPYFAAYDEVADLSRMILANETADLSLNENEFSGFLFDVSLLFENYIRRIFSDGGLWLEPKEKGVVAYPTGGARPRRLLPDITLHGVRSSLILDAKYKWWNEHDGVSREDAFQVITYASVHRKRDPNHPVLGYGFVYPRAASIQAVAAPIERNFAELAMRFYVFFLDIPVEGLFESAEASLVSQVTNALNVLDRTVTGGPYPHGRNGEAP
jgi:5-methylcytosine-specific restriction endonuclease McrBC regulatory subunit McrC